MFFPPRNTVQSDNEFCWSFITNYSHFLKCVLCVSWICFHISIRSQHAISFTAWKKPGLFSKFLPHRLRGDLKFITMTPTNMSWRHKALWVTPDHWSLTAVVPIPRPADSDGTRGRSCLFPVNNDESAAIRGINPPTQNNYRNPAVEMYQ